MTLADSSLASLNRLEEDEIEALKRLKSAKSPGCVVRSVSSSETWPRDAINSRRRRAQQASPGAPSFFSPATFLLAPPP